MTQTQMKDSGERQSFTTGAVRDAAGDKPKLSLMSPFALLRLGDWLTLGAKKYADRNWEKGMPFCRVIDSLLRHTVAYMTGKTDEDHLAAIMTNAMFLAHYEEMIQRGLLPASLDDRPQWEEKTMERAKEQAKPQPMPSPKSRWYRDQMTTTVWQYPEKLFYCSSGHLFDAGDPEKCDTHISISQEAALELLKQFGHTPKFNG